MTITSFGQVVLLAMLSFGIGLLAFSMLYPSSSLAIIGMILISLGAIFLYVKPVKHVPLALLNSSAEVVTANIELLISELNLTERGIYLPPTNLKKEPSLVFIPEATRIPLSTEQANSGIGEEKTGVLVTPPGAALSRLFEKELGFPFTNADLNHIQNKIRKLLVEDMELAESAEIQVQGNIITLGVVGSVLDEICRQTDSQPKTHMQVGCLLSSAFACTLAKATERPVLILNENRMDAAKKTIIEYQIFEKENFEFEKIQLTPLIQSDDRLIEGEAKRVKTRLKTLPLEPPAGLDASTHDRKLVDKKILIDMKKSGSSDGLDSDGLDVEIAYPALDFLEKNRGLYVLADIKNPQYTYTKVKGYDANFVIKFEKFVEICKMHTDSKNSNGLTEFTVKAFGLFIEEKPTDHSLAAYVEKSGFATVDDWIKASRGANEIPDHSIGKMFYLYHIEFACPIALQFDHA